MQNQLSKHQPHGDVFPQAGEVQGLRFSSLGLRRLRFPLQCPQLGFRDLRCRMDELLQKIYVLMSDRRFVVFPGRLDDVSLSANKVKITKGEKKKVISHGSAVCQPQRCKSMSHISVHIKTLSWSNVLLNVALPRVSPTQSAAQTDSAGKR